MNPFSSLPGAEKGTHPTKFENFSGLEEGDDPLDLALQRPYRPSGDKGEEDYWDVTGSRVRGQCRVHVVPRQYAFSPVGITGALVASKYSGERTSVLVDEKTGRMVVYRDNWKAVGPHVRLGTAPSWTGWTYFGLADVEKTLPRFRVRKGIEDVGENVIKEVPSVVDEHRYDFSTGEQRNLPADSAISIECDIQIFYGTHYIPPPVQKRGPAFETVRKRVAVDLHTRELLFDANYSEREGLSGFIKQSALDPEGWIGEHEDAWWIPLKDGVARDLMVYFWYRHDLKGFKSIDENYGPEFWDLDGPQKKGYPYYDAKIARKRAALGDECVGSDDERLLDRHDFSPPPSDHPVRLSEDEPDEPSPDAILTAKQWPVERIDRALLGKLQMECIEFGMFYEAAQPCKDAD